MMGSKSFVFHFADVEVKEREFRVIKAGEVLPVEPKAFRVLLFLLRNPQKLITKEELLNAVWGDVAVSENSLARAITLLRRQLGDDIREPRYIATIPTVGYRFLCPVDVLEDVPGNVEESGKGGEANSGTGPESESTVTVDVTPPAKAQTNNNAGPDPKPRTVRAWRLAAVFLILVCIPAAIWYLDRPLPTLRITEDAQITHDGHRKWLGGTDGSRLYFNELAAITPNQVSVAGGDNTPISIALRGALICCVSPDGSTLLIQTWDDENIWSAGILGSPLRHLTKVDTPSATWSPDGKTVVYTTTDGSIFLMRSDGTEARKLASVGGPILDIAWSPDGSKFRFSKDDVLWEMSSSGSIPHRLLPNWPVSSGHCCGRWTPDGRFFAFLSGVKNLKPNSAFPNSQIWFLDERGGLFRRPSSLPQQLISGPIGWCCITPSRDGRTLFATGATARGELVRFDARTGQLLPYLGGISAEFLSFSRDGKSVVYVSFPDGVLSRANSDGSGRVQLSDPPTYPKGTRWSPDGSRLIFFDSPASNGEDVMYSMPSQGGKPTRVLPEDSGLQDDPGWSPDGSKVVYFARPETDIRILDVASHHVTSLPESAGLFSPRWSPDGKSIAALTTDNLALKIFDLATQRWSTLLKREGSIGFPNWSHDGRYVYILYLNDEPGIYRIPATGGEAARVVDLTGFHHTGTVTYWFGLDPTDAPLLLRDAGTEDIYALTLETK